MKSGRRLTKEAKIEIATQLCDLYATDKYIITECCKAVGIVAQTFYSWLEEIPEINELYENAINKATKQFGQRLKQKALRGLEKRVQGEVVPFTETTYERVPVKKIKDGVEITAWEVMPKTIKKGAKYIPPSDTSIFFALTNLMPETFKNQHSVTIENDFDKMSIEELDKLIAEKQAELSKSNPNEPDQE